MFGFTKNMTVVCNVTKKKNKSVILLSTEICGYDIRVFRSEQRYKSEVDPLYNRTKGATDAGGQIRRARS